MQVTMQGKYTTRGSVEYPSQPVRILCVDASFSPCSRFRNTPVVGIIKGEEGIRTWRNDGSSLDMLSVPSSFDLVPVLTKREGWIIINKDRHPAIASMWVYDTQQEAESARLNTCYPTAYIVVPISWET